MKHRDQIFTDIARDLLGIETLTPRNADRLDFHEVAVWSVRDALSAAFEAGTGSKPRDPLPTLDLGDTTLWSYRESEYDPHVWEIMAEWYESPIAEVPRWMDDEGVESLDARANLALIVAAPRLLAACRLVVERWERGDLAGAVRLCDALLAEFRPE